VLLCVVVCCSSFGGYTGLFKLPCAVVCCRELQCATAPLVDTQDSFSCSVLQCVAVCCSVLQCVAICRSVLQLLWLIRRALSVAVCYRVLQ